MKRRGFIGSALAVAVTALITTKAAAQPQPPEGMIPMAEFDKFLWDLLRLEAAGAITTGILREPSRTMVQTRMTTGIFMAVAQHMPRGTNVRWHEVSEDHKFVRVREDRALPLGTTTPGIGVFDPHHYKDIIAWYYTPFPKVHA